MAIGGRRPLRGRKLGDRRVRIERPYSPYFRWSGPGRLTAKAAASAPTSRVGRTWAATKRVLIGRPLANEEEIGERLSKKKALAIFRSDALSPSPYATVESNGSQGGVYVFQKPASGWANGTETAKLTASDGAAGDCLGCSAAASSEGSTLVAGAGYATAGGKAPQGAV